MPAPRASLRPLAIAALIFGTIGSVGCMLRVGHRNPSWLLLLMFVAWVAAPFAALAWAMRAFARRPSGVQRAIDVSAMLVAVASIAVYGRVAFGPPRPRPAAPFLITPPVLLALAFVVVALSTRTRQAAE
jgi:hypothetical protein